MILKVFGQFVLAALAMAALAGCAATAPVAPIVGQTPISVQTPAGMVPAADRTPRIY